MWRLFNFLLFLSTILCQDYALTYSQIKDNKTIVQWEDLNGGLFFVHQSEIFQIKKTQADPVKIRIISTPINEGYTIPPSFSINGLTGDSNGNLFFTDCKKNFLIKLSLMNNCSDSYQITHLHNYLGNIADSPLSCPLGITFYRENLYVVDSGTCSIRKITGCNETKTLEIKTIVGSSKCATNDNNFTSFPSHADGVDLPKISDLWWDIQTSVLHIPDSENNRMFIYFPDSHRLDVRSFPEKLPSSHKVHGNDFRTPRRDVFQQTVATYITISGVNSGDQVGYAVSLGDVNNDGKDDMVIGAPYFSSGAGIVYVVYGGTSLSTSISLSTFSGIYVAGASGYNLGMYIDVGGDVNADGIGDFAIGAPSYATNTGLTLLVFGGTTLSSMTAPLTTSQAATVSGTASNVYSGCSVSINYYHNGGGIADPVFAAYGINTNRGRVYYILGSNTITTLTSLTSIGGSQYLSGAGNGYKSGYTIASGGDANGDGKNDVLIGAPGATSNTGYAYLVFGGVNWGGISSMNLGSSEGRTFTGTGTNSYTGSSLSLGGDVNDDSEGDILIGAYGRSGTGVVYLLFGGTSISDISLASITMAKGVTLYGESSGDQFGFSLSLGGDFNGDGVADIIIGAPGYSSNTGRIYIIYGGTSLSSAGSIYVTSLTSSTGITITGPTTGPLSCTAGFSVSLKGDINADGKN